MAGHGEEEPPLTVGELSQLLGFLSGTFVFLILIGLDLRNAIKKGANWVPGYALVLSALTIQAMNFVENQGALLNQLLDSSNKLSGDVVKNNLFMIHISRVMLCVLVAFFLPVMARPGYQEKWTKILALGLSVLLDIFSELLIAHRRLGHSGLYVVTYIFYTWPHPKTVNVVSFVVSGAIILISLIWLIGLLICANIASKSIRNHATQRVLYILGKPEEDTWKALEDQVLKSWIVSRACNPESIIASSVLGSSAALGVTVCIISSIVGWIVQGPEINLLQGAGFWLKFIMAVMEVTFILIGWAIIGWRWLTSVAYYGNYMLEQQSWSEYFRVEDFWTRDIVEQREAEESKLTELKVDERMSKILARKLRELKVDDRDVSRTALEGTKSTSLKWIFLVCVFRLQWLVVFLSKAYYFLTEFTLCNKLFRWVASILLKNHLDKVKQDFAKDSKLLGNVKVLWQTPESVFSTNRRSIKQAKKIIEKGNEDDEHCRDLIWLLQTYWSGQTPVGIGCLDPGSAHHETGLKSSCPQKCDEEQVPVDVEKYFMYASKRSWKLTAVSLIAIIVWLSSPSERDCLPAYYQAWELMDLVEESDPEIHSLLSKAADSLFNALCNSKETAKSANQTPDRMEEPKKAIQTLAKECEEEVKKKAEIIDKGKDSPVDWESLVARNAIYKLCMSIDCSSGNFDDLMNELRTSLANNIGDCLERVGEVLVDKCRTWAQDLEKRKLREALYIAGKYKGVMEKLGVERVPKLQIAPRAEESVMVSVIAS